MTATLIFVQPPEADAMASEFDMTATVCIEAPADEVWRCLARIEDIPLWSRAIISASTVPGHERGVGAER
ncbi:MAG: hypothetical protein J2P28_27135, partial [Actinobacteria bacterium]|nr:hypothetical protein [Actinomycetota bacterium]